MTGCWTADKPPAPAKAPVVVAAPSRTALTGRYRVAHEIPMVCDPPTGGLDCAQSVEDTMTLRERSDGGLHATISLVQTNAHSCTFEEDLAPAGDRRWKFDAVEDGPCHVDLVQDETTIEIQSEGCRYYCGVRARLEATFPFPPKRR